MCEGKGEMGKQGVVRKKRKGEEGKEKIKNKK